MCSSSHRPCRRSLVASCLSRPNQWLFSGTKNHISYGVALMFVLLRMIMEIDKNDHCFGPLPCFYELFDGRRESNHSSRLRIRCRYLESSTTTIGTIGHDNIFRNKHNNTFSTYKKFYKKTLHPLKNFCEKQQVTSTH